jgi:2-succinyl-6-hydroxy-2,4-cyclohexadiene-1-carboxylate synthase
MNQLNYTINAIPGFLGLPADWDRISWPKLNKINSLDYCWDSLPAWGKDFNQKHHLKFLEPTLLMGYSLGGRLALHALLDQPQKWQGAIIISSHYGLADQKSCQQRLIQDEKWAQRFEKEPWPLLMQAWNDQKIFKNDLFIPRLEEDYKRPQLSQQLRNGSLGRQKNLKQAIEQIQLPLLWITGALDQSSSELASHLSFCHPLSQKLVIKNAGHRVPWYQSLQFQQSIEQFIKTLTISC